MNHHRPEMNDKDKEGLAFGEAVLMSSPPSRSQIEVKLESGFGGRADEKIKTAREAVLHLGRKKSHPQHLTIAPFAISNTLGCGFLEKVAISVCLHLSAVT